MKVCEIFASIQGESSYAGVPCVFVRLSGCNLRCAYCDTTYSYEEGTEMSRDEVLEKVRAFGLDLVEITGGEPLLQQDETLRLAERLLDSGYRVLMETNGSFSISGIDPRAVVIMDVKTPSSSMSQANDFSNFDLLKITDEVKFVISDRDDYEWSRKIVLDHGLGERCVVLFSPAYGRVAVRDLAEWIVGDRLGVRLNLQIHKYIFGPDERQV